MGNTPQLGRYQIDPRFDLGLGYCYRCVQFMALNTLAGPDGLAKLQGFVPNFACTMAPWPLGPGVVLALPACFPCQIGEGKAGQPGAGSGLIAVNGKVPGL